MASALLWPSLAETLFGILQIRQGCGPAGFAFSREGSQWETASAAPAPLRGAAAAAAEGPINRRSEKKVQRRRPPPAADTGRSCWGSGQQDTSAAQGTKWTLGTATRLSEAASFFVWSPSSLGLKGASSPFLVGPARRNRWHFSGSLLVPKENKPRPAAAHRNRRALAALNTRHLLRKPVCGLKAPLGLSCPPGTAVLSGSLLCGKREHIRRQCLLQKAQNFRHATTLCAGSIFR